MNTWVKRRKDPAQTTARTARRLLCHPTNAWPLSCFDSNIRNETKSQCQDMWLILAIPQSFCHAVSANPWVGQKTCWTKSEFLLSSTPFPLRHSIPSAPLQKTQSDPSRSIRQSTTYLPSLKHFDHSIDQQIHQINNSSQKSTLHFSCPFRPSSKQKLGPFRPEIHHVWPENIRKTSGRCPRMLPQVAGKAWYHGFDAFRKVPSDLSEASITGAVMTLMAVAGMKFFVRCCVMLTMMIVIVCN